ncbi:MAG: ABC transporter permease [Bryobacteraceae bacterium]
MRRAFEFLSKGSRETNRPPMRREFPVVGSGVAAAFLLARDLRHAARSMRANPWFALTAIATLCLGIGANTAVFSVVKAVLLKPLPYQNSQELVRITGGATQARFEAMSHAINFSGVGAYLVVEESVALAGFGSAEPLNGARVSTNFLSILGASPIVGRSFLPEEERPGASVAMISADLWRRRFGGDRGAVGKTVRMAGAPCQIVGVAPEGLRFPFSDVDVWRPWQPDAVPLPSRRHSPMLSVFGRLGPGVDMERASAEVALINERYRMANPDMLDAKRRRPEPLLALKDQIVRDVRPVIWMLFGAVGFVLLIACANVASLLLARTAARSREFAIRSALGASRARLAAQTLAEGLLLAGGGCVAGMLGAGWALRSIERIPWFDLPRAEEIQLDGGVLAFAAALSLATCALFAIGPAMRSSRPDLAGAISGTRWKRLPRWLSPRPLLVAGQVALAIVLSIGAALMIQSLSRLHSIDPGFRPAHILTFRLTLAEPHLNEFVERVESIPGVESAGVTLTLPTTGFAATPVHVVGRALRSLNQRPFATLQSVTPGYFHTLGIGLKRGRLFTGADGAGSPKVAVINEALARRFWPEYPKGEDPVGQSLLAGASLEPVRIAGIVADVRQASLGEEPDPGLYRPRTQTPPMSAMFAVRTAGDPLRYVNAIRSELAAIDGDQTMTAVRTMEDVIERSEGRRRTVLMLLGLFAGTGLLLAMTGIYGVTAHAVVQRTREIGIRRALGAPPGAIMALMLRQGLALAVAGALAGAAAAMALTRSLQAVLYSVSPVDPPTFAGVMVLAIAAAIAASYIPARRAARIAPATALRDRQSCI